mgnify:CR=1 FL=1
MRLVYAINRNKGILLHFIGMPFWPYEYLCQKRNRHAHVYSIYRITYSTPRVSYGFERKTLSKSPCWGSFESRKPTSFSPKSCKSRFMNSSKKLCFRRTFPTQNSSSIFYGCFLNLKIESVPFKFDACSLALKGVWKKWKTNMHARKKVGQSIIDFHRGSYKCLQYV